jgi:hypothetical protein
MVGNKPGVDDHDPRLVELLNNGLGAQFERGRERGLEMLDSEDIAGFWLQAIGTGRPLATVHEPERPNPTLHQVTHLAGYADDLEYQGVNAMSTFLCGQHFGFSANPVGRDPKTVCDELLGWYGPNAERMYGEMIEEFQYPEPVSLSRRLEQARELLRHERLTFAWLQVVPDREETRTFLRVDPSQGTERWDIQDEDFAEVEYLLCTPDDGPQDLGMQILGQSLLQHLFVSARTAERSPEEFTEQVKSVMLSSSALYDGIDPL